MGEHTPGPWSVFPHYCKYDGPGPYENTWLIGKGQYDTIAEVRPGHDEYDSQNDANARLIAAAPDLLEACKQAKKFLEPVLDEPGRTVFWSLVDAIAKATGTPLDPRAGERE